MEPNSIENGRVMRSIAETPQIRDGATLFDLWTVSVRHRWQVLVFCLLGGGLGIGAYFIVEPVYRAETLLAPASDQEPIPGTGGLGSIGGLLGLGLPTGESSIYEAIAVLESRAFSNKFVETNDLLPILFDEYWDVESKSWKDDITDDLPTLGDAHEYLDEIRQVQLDEVTGLVTVSVEWKDPERAADWANLMIQQVNETLRARAVQDSEKNLAFLRNELSTTRVVETRESIYEVMEAQLTEIMLANTRAEYAFRILDPAVPAERDEFVWPSLWHLLAAGIALGLLSGVATALARELRLRQREANPDETTGSEKKPLSKLPSANGP